LQLTENSREHLPFLMYWKCHKYLCDFNIHRWYLAEHFFVEHSALANSSVATNQASESDSCVKNTREEKCLSVGCTSLLWNPEIHYRLLKNSR